MDKREEVLSALRSNKMTIPRSHHEMIAQHMMGMETKYLIDVLRSATAALAMNMFTPEQILEENGPEQFLKAMAEVVEAHLESTTSPDSIPSTWTELMEEHS